MQAANFLNSSKQLVAIGTFKTAINTNLYPKNSEPLGLFEVVVY